MVLPQADDVGQPPVRTVVDSQPAAQHRSFILTPDGPSNGEVLEKRSESSRPTRDMAENHAL
jgi:hypothetical protein